MLSAVRASALAFLASMVVVAGAAPAAAESGPPVVVGTDNNGGAVDTTVNSPGGPGHSTSVGGVGRPVSTGHGGSGVTCTYTYPGSDGQPFEETRNGVPGRYYFVDCTDGSHTLVWIPDSSPPSRTGPPPPTVTPAQLAQQAVNRLPLPAPAAHHNPDRSDGRPQTVVGVRTWLWVSSASYRVLTQTTSAGPVSATVTATPVRTEWHSGSPDAADVTCDGPGAAYDAKRPDDEQSTTCATTYRRSSADQPQRGPDPNDRFFTASVTTVWRVTWVGSDGTSGALPELRRTTTFPLAVAELQTVNSR